MEVVALELIRQLQKSDKKNEYIIFAKEDADINCLKETENFKIETIPAYSYADWEQIQLPKALKKSKIDFLHSTCNTSALWQSNPLLLTLHDIIYLEKVDFNGTAYQNFGNLYRRFVVPKVINKSTSIITVSHFERDTILERLHLPEEKVQVVYNAVSDIFHSNYPVEQVNNFRLKHEIPEKFVLFLGNTAPKKNTKGVLTAYVEYCQCTDEPVPMVILDHDRAYVLTFLTEINKKHLISHFVFPGYIAPQQMPMMYNAATIFLYPSLRESFGLPILEAMACGTPVISSTSSSMPEVAGGAALLVDPYQEKDIAEGIQKLLSDSIYYSSLVEKGLKRAAEFTWNSSAKALLSIYDTFDN